MGELISHQLLLAGLASIISTDSSTSKIKRADPNIGPDDNKIARQPAGRVLPAEPFHADRWSAIDTDVKFIGERIVHIADPLINHLVTYVKLQDMVSTLDPFDLGVVGGTLNSSTQLDGHATPMQARVALAARHFKIKQLFPKIGSTCVSMGEINGGVWLSATGNSVSALLDSSNGEAKILMEQGIIGEFTLEAMGLNVDNVVLTKLLGDKRATTSCTAGDSAVSNGLIQARIFVVDIQNAVIDVIGATSFKQEALDFIIHPDLKGLRMFSLRMPPYMKGIYKHPDVSVNPAVMALQAGGAVVLALTTSVAAILLVFEFKPAPGSTCGRLPVDVH